MHGSRPPGSAWGGDTVGSHTCGHEAVCGQQKLWGDLHSHLRVRKLKQGEVMPLPLPVRDPLLFPIVGCGDHRGQNAATQNHCWFLEVFPELWGTDRSSETTWISAASTVDDITSPREWKDVDQGQKVRGAVTVSVLSTLRWCTVEKGKGWPGTPKVRVLELVPYLWAVQPL